MHIKPCQGELCADALLLGVGFTESRYIATCSESQPVTQLSFVAQHDLILTAQCNKSDATAAGFVRQHHGKTYLSISD